MPMMRFGWRWFGLAVVAGLASGCVARDLGAGEEMAEAFRSGGLPTPPNYPGNGDIALYAGVGTTSADCLIYDFVGPNVHDGAAPVGPVIATVVDNSIQVPGGATVCTREGNALVDRVRVGGPDGEVLFTAFGRWVFEGELDFEGDNLGQIAQELVDQLLFTFQGPHIYDGLHIHGDIVVTSTKPLTHASTKRKLVIAAMLTGECGGLGLEEDEDEDGEHDY
jgi:hypothetical protein